MSETGTRERLLEAAGQVFGERGYRGATIRQICKAAGANVAAVNYHFEHKEGLYHEVLAHAFGKAMQGQVPAGPAGSLEERLRRLVQMLLGRVFSASASWHGQVIARELAEPTAGLQQVVTQFMQPMLYRLDRMLQEACPDLNEEQRRLHCFSLISQCVFFRHARPVLDLMFGPHAYTSETIPHLTDHIVTVFLRGLGIKTGPPDG
jgi:AcrR family transcriptional regulator